MAILNPIILLYIVFLLVAAGLNVTLVVLAIKALWKYLHTREKQQQQNAPQRQRLAQTLRQDRDMTQEFVAETLGVSRQAVSKWENGTADPTTTNLFALARLYGVAPQDLLKE